MSSLSGKCNLKIFRCDGILWGAGPYMVGVGAGPSAGGERNMEGIIKIIRVN